MKHLSEYIRARHHRPFQTGSFALWNPGGGTPSALVRIIREDSERIRTVELESGFRFHTQTSTLTNQ